jgi:hypothetical protein
MAAIRGEIAVTGDPDAERAERPAVHVSEQTADAP